MKEDVGMSKPKKHWEVNVGPILYIDQPPKSYKFNFFPPINVFSK